MDFFGHFSSLKVMTSQDGTVDKARRILPDSNQRV